MKAINRRRARISVAGSVLLHAALFLALASLPFGALDRVGNNSEKVYTISLSNFYAPRAGQEANGKAEAEKGETAKPAEPNERNNPEPEQEPAPEPEPTPIPERPAATPKPDAKPQPPKTERPKNVRRPERAQTPPPPATGQSGEGRGQERTDESTRSGDTPGGAEGAVFGTDTVDEAPVMRLRKEPVFPPVAERRRIAGRVLLSCIVDTEGVPEAVALLKASPPGYGFEQAAMAALSASRFIPGKVKGRAVKTRIEQEYIFRAK